MNIKQKITEILDNTSLKDFEKVCIRADLVILINRTLNLYFTELGEKSTHNNKCDLTEHDFKLINVGLADKLDKEMRYLADHQSYDLVFDKVLSFISDELLEINGLNKELQDAKDNLVLMEFNYLQQINELKNQLDIEHASHAADLEAKWEDIYADANIAAMKKYQPVKYEKLKIDVESGYNLNDINSITFQ